MRTQFQSFCTAVAFIFFASLGLCADEAQGLISNRLADVLSALEQSEVIKAHPEIVITKDSQSLVIAYHVRDWPNNQNKRLDGSPAKELSTVRGPFQDGFLMTVEFSKISFEPEKEWGTRRFSRLILEPIFPDLRYDQSAIIPRSNWKTYGCEATRARVTTRVTLDYTQFTDLKLLGEVFVPVASLCARKPNDIDPILVSGGLSPSKQFAVVVYTDKVAEELSEPEDDAVFLMDARTQKRIGRLEEVDAGGGGWGRTSSNVSAHWSPDSKWLAVTFRVGRMMHSFVLYSITGHHASPITLPDASTHPKGKVFDYLTTNANPGESFGEWISKSEFVIVEYGLRPKEANQEFDFSKFGLGNFDGELEEVYRLTKDGKWKLKDIRVPKSDRN